MLTELKEVRSVVAGSDTDAWIWEVESAYLAAFDPQARVRGIAAPFDAEPNPAIVGRIAELAARMRKRVLVVSMDCGADASAGSWIPGDAPPAAAIVRGSDGIDHWTIRYTQATRALLTDAAELRRTFASLTGYDEVIVVIPGQRAEASQRVFALPVAAACDGVMLIARLGEVKAGDFSTLVERWKAGHVHIGGIIAEGSREPTAGAAIARSAMRLEGLAPGFARWISKAAQKSGLLN
ncbi:MAG: hypothetical protein JSS20_11840 [Proteobacteria bacterium]|nr:hypothetical protein [Pseudomonadota bacterium]